MNKIQHKGVLEFSRSGEIYFYFRNNNTILVTEEKKIHFVMVSPSFGSENFKIYKNGGILWKTQTTFC